MRHRPVQTSCLLVLVIATAQPALGAAEGDPLVLADSGRTEYAIVIGSNPHLGEDRAAQELAHFLWAMTGAEFPVRKDNTPESAFELVVGSTNRKKMEDIPENLMTDNW